MSGPVLKPPPEVKKRKGGHRAFGTVVEKKLKKGEGRKKYVGTRLLVGFSSILHVGLGEFMAITALCRKQGADYQV